MNFISKLLAALLLTLSVQSVMAQCNVSYDAQGRAMGYHGACNPNMGVPQPVINSPGIRQQQSYGQPTPQPGYGQQQQYGGQYGQPIPFPLPNGETGYCQPGTVPVSTYGRISCLPQQQQRPPYPYPQPGYGGYPQPIPRPVPVYGPPQGVPCSSAAGAIVGAVIGSNVAGRNNRTVGGIIGALVGGSIECGATSNRQPQYVQQARPMQVGSYTTEHPSTCNLADGRRIPGLSPEECDSIAGKQTVVHAAKCDFGNGDVAEGNCEDEAKKRATHVDATCKIDSKSRGQSRIFPNPSGKESYCQNELVNRLRSGDIKWEDGKPLNPQ